MAVLTTLGVPDNTGNTTTIMPKLQYRFRVTFIGAGFSATPTRSVVSAGRPTLTHDPITLEAYNSRIYLAGKHTWGDVAIIIRDDVDSAVMKEINQQMNRQVDHANQSSSRSGSGYKFTVKVETLDGASPTPGVLDTYELSGCYIQGVTYGELNYATNDSITMTVTLKYDNAEIYDAAGNATLTGITPAQNTSNATGG
jgi:hypothetical protein